MARYVIPPEEMERRLAAERRVSGQGAAPVDERHLANHGYPVWMDVLQGPDFGLSPRSASLITARAVTENGAGLAASRSADFIRKWAGDLRSRQPVVWNGYVEGNASGVGELAERIQRAPR